jgi:hypothetical protein
MRLKNGWSLKEYQYVEIVGRRQFVVAAMARPDSAR